MGGGTEVTRVTILSETSGQFQGFVKTFYVRSAGRRTETTAVVPPCNEKIST